MRKNLIIVLISLLLIGCGVDYKFKKAQELEKQGKHELAVVKYLALTEKYPNSSWAADALFSVAEIYDRQEDLVNAQSHYSKLIERFPDYPKAAYAQFKIAEISLRFIEFDTAETYFQNIVDKFPQTKYAEQSKEKLLEIAKIKKEVAKLMGEGELSYKRSEFEKAIEKFGQVLILNPAHQNAKKKKEQARTKQIESLIEEGDALCQRQRFTRAIATYRRIHEIDPTNPIVREKISSAELKRKGIIVHSKKSALIEKIKTLGYEKTIKDIKVYTKEGSLFISCNVTNNKNVILFRKGGGRNTSAFRFWLRDFFYEIVFKTGSLAFQVAPYVSSVEWIFNITHGTHDEYGKYSEHTKKAAVLKLTRSTAEQIQDWKYLAMKGFFEGTHPDWLLFESHWIAENYRD